MGKNDDVIGFDSDHASRIEGDIIRIAGRIESIIGDRETQVKFVKDNWDDNNAGDTYSSVEQDWKDAADETLQLVHDARRLLGENSVTATDASGKVVGIWS
ncbi:hypothetical protein [Arthrobacter sp.]|uniref:hypothetical protein n=1 Tax=Arthrobacter sp. TaxID=1667 RepID=UPI003A8C8A27